MKRAGARFAMRLGTVLHEAVEPPRTPRLPEGSLAVKRGVSSPFAALTVINQRVCGSMREINPEAIEAVETPSGWIDLTNKRVSFETVAWLASTVTALVIHDDLGGSDIFIPITSIVSWRGGDQVVPPQQDRRAHMPWAEE
jgi:hypothetical protein